MTIKVTQTWSRVEYEVAYDDLKGEYERHYLDIDTDVQMHQTDEGQEFSDFVLWRVGLISQHELEFRNYELVEHDESVDKEIFVFRDISDDTSYSIMFEVV